ncbi:MAG: ribonuclease HI [Cyanobacteria bacterium SBLK]|nr:ribonuclease HI [Cyanobacteria bacterium SBLK]
MSYPLRSGWKEALIGRKIEVAIAEEFIALKNKHLKKSSLTPTKNIKKQIAKQDENIPSIIPKSDTSSRKEVIIYTDGACSGNPGTGGWGAILKYGEHCKELSGSAEEKTTNNRMEMMAVIEALKALKYPCLVYLHTDSQLIVNTMTRNWKRKTNQDLWAEIDRLARIHQVKWIWVKGHASDPLNNRVDRLAVAASKAALNGDRE